MLPAREIETVDAKGDDGQKDKNAGVHGRVYLVLAAGNVEAEHSDPRHKEKGKEVTHGPFSM